MFLTSGRQLYFSIFILLSGIEVGIQRVPGLIPAADIMYMSIIKPYRRLEILTIMIARKNAFFWDMMSFYLMLDCTKFV
jgi:hypothetical protein